jgi:ATP-dependent DNA helicase RecG
MSSSLEKLHKVVLLEVKRNFDNKAVVGGLQKILTVWTEEAQHEKVDPQIINDLKIKIEGYHQVGIDNRSQVIKDIIDVIETATRKSPELQSLQSAEQPAEKLPYKTPPANKKITPEGNKSMYTRMLLAPVISITGIGESMSARLEKLGITTIKDLLNYYPRRYDDFSNLLPINRLEYGQEVTAIGIIKSIASRPTKNPRITITEAIISDGTGYLRLTWFNQPYLENSIKAEDQIVVSGKVERYLGRLSLNSPEWEKLEKEQLHTNRIVPIYSLTADLKQRALRNVIFKTVNYWASHLDDFLPSSIRQQAHLMDMQDAISQIHFPDSMENLQKAQHRIAFDEIFLLQIGALQQKRRWQSGTAQPFIAPDEWFEDKIARLPYQLTSAQKKTMQEIRDDLSSGIPMNRLLQGDVGSGKTVVAAMACAVISHSGAQSVVLAPTSILAEQHFKTFQTLLSTSEDAVLKLLAPESIRLLIGDTPPSEKEEILTGLSNGQVKLVIGTHAVLEDPVKFINLQFAVIDEQHRFGVKQRSILRAKGTNPHLLVMTATPIPRSLALTIYGDLDLSVIDEMPAGRQAVETHVLHPLERERAYALIRSQIQNGSQAFVIYPLVEEDEEIEESKAAVNEYERLSKEVFSHARVGLVHGRLNQEEKDKAMSAFRDRELDVLVSTSVIEVGVDIPNATVMLIESANRFGLAQLHQFRGRVGRGLAKSFCLLIPETEDSLENERLLAMVSTNDGFALAEQDLAQRGPGEFFGVSQSGYSNLRIASLSNIQLIEQARFFANELFKSDPELILPDHQNIKPLVNYHWNEGQGDIS